MGNPDLGKLVKSVKSSLAKHSPEILTGIGIVGMATAAVMAVRATPKALECMAKVKTEHRDKLDDKRLIGKEIVKRVGPHYIPAAATWAMSAVCLIGASTVNARRNAAIATAYALSESALREYQKKVVEAIGEKKEQGIRDAVAKSRISSNPASSNEVIVTPKGNTLFYDSVSGRYFRSDIDKIRKIESELNRRLYSEMYVSLNEFYYELDIPGIKIGDELGWAVEKGPIDIRFSAQLAEDDTPCIVIDYVSVPKYDCR